MAKAKIAGESGTLREKAYRSFTRHLLASHFRPGQFVSQRDLVELTGMPLGAIRELVPRLEAEGLITTVPQRGMQIAAIDFNLVRDAYQFRAFMEKEAVVIFTEEAPDSAIVALRARHEAVLRKAEAENPADPAIVAEAQAVDWEMHDTIIDAVRNEILSKSYRVNSLKIRLIHQSLTRINGHVIPVMREHLGIIAAIQARDARLAAERLAAHIADARNRALGLR
jgi:DNA-binding GntR family transcriptional regulator